MINNDLFLQRKFKEVAKFIKPGSKILDIGCNEGKIRYYLKEPNYFGVDLDKNLIEKLKSEGVQAKIVNLNKEDIPFQNQKFDYILLLDIIEHVADSRNLIQNSKKLLNPQGRLIITLPNDYHLMNKLRFCFNLPLTEDVFSPYGHLHYFPIRIGQKFLNSNGLKIIKKVYLAPIKPRIIPYFIKNILSKVFPQNFSRDILYICS